MIKKTPLLVIFLMILLIKWNKESFGNDIMEESNSLANVSTATSDPFIPTQPIQNNTVPSHLVSEKELLKASAEGNIESVKKIIASNSTLPFHLARQGAKNAAEGGHVDIFRMLYLLDSDPFRDNVLIPSIRHSGHLNAFYISLADNGNIDVLERLIGADCLFNTNAINKIFDAALIAYKGTKSISMHD